MRKVLLVTTIILATVSLVSSYSFSESGDSLFESSQSFTQNIFQLYNQQDFKKIYKDLTSSRLKSSQDFAEFESTLSKIYQRTGKAIEQKPNILMREDYEEMGLQFFRFEFLVSHENRETVQRIVLMRDKDSWLLDGIAIATTDDILLAIGNLYNFDHAKAIINKQAIWTQSQFKEIWNDTKTDSIEKNALGRLKGFIMGPNDLPIGVIRKNYNPDGSLRR